MYKIKFTFLLLVSSLISFSAWAQSADEAIGKARLVIGKVTVSSSVSGDGALIVGDNIFLGDKVSTPATGYAVITLNEGTKFTVKPKSEFRFDTVDEASGQVVTNLIKGGLKSITGSIGKNNPDGFKVDTPLGSIGIRGTNFDALLCLSEEDCSLLNEALGCPDSEPAPIVGLLYVTVSDGMAYLDQCDEDVNISPSQTGTTDGTRSSCKLLEETPCFLETTTFQQNAPSQVKLSEPIQDDIGLLCQGDPVCIQCEGDAVCTQCDGDALCMQCQGDALCMQCEGEAICMTCQGDNLCRQCQGDAICLQCQGDVNCLACQGDPLCLQCNGDPVCIDCNGDAACINPPISTPPIEEPPVVIDPCNGDPICQMCDGNVDCLMCNGNADCLACDGNVNCLMCDGNVDCLACDGVASCLMCDGEIDCLMCGDDAQCLFCLDNPTDDSCLSGPMCPIDFSSGACVECAAGGFTMECLCDYDGDGAPSSCFST